MDVCKCKMKKKWSCSIIRFITWMELFRNDAIDIDENERKKICDMSCKKMISCFRFQNWYFCSMFTFYRALFVY